MVGVGIWEWSIGDRIAYSYTVKLVSNSSVVSGYTTSGTNPTVFTGLTASTAYNVTVTATNPLGSVLGTIASISTSAPYAVASLSANPGATKTTNGSYAVFTFTTSGTFTVAQAGYASVLIVGGGGHGGQDNGGGGGAGGLVYFDLATKPMSLTAQAYTVTVGTGANYAYNGSRVNGNDSTFNGYTAKGGGSGAGNDTQSYTGGCSSGSAGFGTVTAASNQPSYSNAYYVGGNVGGTCSGATTYVSGGGGGAGGVGGNISGTNVGGTGGAGYQCNITGSNVYYAGGGGGGCGDGYTPGAGGSGVGGAGAGRGTSPGTSNNNGGNGIGYGCGGGGGGGGGGGTGGNGSNGVVIILCLSTA